MIIAMPDKNVVVPEWVRDHASFRRWACSDEYPERGQFSWLGGQLWADLSMEELFTHNLLKTEFTSVLGPIAREAYAGYFMSDRMLFSHPEAGLSTEPDAMFVYFESIRTGRMRLLDGRKGCIEIEGSPDIALEIVSRSSVGKDTVRLRDLYHRAGVVEYWLVDARRSPLRFEILRHQPEGFVATESADGWVRSELFGKSFRLLDGTDPLGHPKFTLEAR
jgi:Uma2 family endonuclease